MGGDERAEIARLQVGIRALVSRAVHGPGLREMSARGLLSLLCAAAFAPFLVVGAGTGAAVVASIGVLSSVGSGVLSGVLASACDRLRSGEEREEESEKDLEKEIADQLERILSAEDSNSLILRGEIAEVLRTIGVGETMLKEAIDSGNEAVRRDVIAAIGVLDNDLSEMRFLIEDIQQATTAIVKNQDYQSAEFRALGEQSAAQAAEFRRALADLMEAVERNRSAEPDEARAKGQLRWVSMCPYRGLAPYREVDAEVFYGRERLTSELTTRLAQQVARGGLVAVTGASGAGKSSLLRAGLAPALARGEQLSGSQRWPRIVMTPTKNPLTELATRLSMRSGQDGPSMMDVRRELFERPDQAYLTIRQVLLADMARRAEGPLTVDDDLDRLVLIVDQFEQVFTLREADGDDAEQDSFVTALLAAATHPCGPHDVPAGLVVIAVRGDYWDRCASYPQLASALEEGRFVVGPMIESDLRRAITGPADAAGLTIEPGLTDAILSELRTAGGESAAGVLPLLSQAMLLTWENREGDQLTSHGYGRTGGLSKAVEASADSVYDSLRPDQQPLAQKLLRAMTVVSGAGVIARRPVSRAGLCGIVGADRTSVDTVLESFAEKRLLVLDEHLAQISHDALLTAWPKLSGWLEDDQASWILHGQLSGDATDWHESGSNPSFLYRGTHLVEVQEAARQWLSDPDRYPALTDIQAEFLRASERAEIRRILLRRGAIAILAVLALVASIAFVAAIFTAKRLSQQRDQAVYNQTLAEALQLGGVDASLAAQLDLTAYDIQPTPDVTSRLLNFENDQLPTPLTGLPAAVGSVAFSPDGRLLASGYGDGTVQLWAAPTSREPRPIGQLLTGPKGTVNAVVFTPDGQVLASGNGDGTVRLWDVANPDRPRSLGQALTGSNGAVDSVAFSPDGRTLASGGSDGTVRLWDVADPTHPRSLGSRLTGPSDAVSSVAFGPSVLAVASYSGKIWLWNVSNPALPRALGQPLIASAGSALSTIAFSLDGRTLASGGSDGTVRLWDVANPATARPLGRPLIGSTGTVDSVAFSPAGHALVSGGNDGTVRLWDVANPAAPTSLGPPITGPAGAVNSVTFGPDGRTLATGNADHSVWLWNLPRTILTGHTAAVDTVAFSPDGRVLASGSTDQTVRLWDTANPADPRPLGRPLTGATGTVDAVAFSPDGRTLASGSYDGTVRLWDITDPAHPHMFGPPLITYASYVQAIAYSPSGRTLAIGSSAHSVQLWDVTNPAYPQPLGAPLGSGDTISSVAFSPNGRVLASGSYDGTVRLWNVENRADPKELGQPLIGAGGYVLSVAFSRNGHMLASGNFDGAVQLWDVTTRPSPGSSAS